MESYQQFFTHYSDKQKLNVTQQHHYEDLNGYFEQHMHHYLPKKVPQASVKIYKVNSVSSRIEEEQVYVAEKYQGEEPRISEGMMPGGKSKSARLTNLDITSLIALLDKKQEEEAREKKAQEEAARQRKMSHSSLEDDVQITPPSTDASLWVDKYTSLKFFDLLTDEVTNRNVLTWLKTWDEVVFPSQGKVNFSLPEHIAARQNFSHSGYYRPTIYNLLEPDSGHIVAPQVNFFQQQQDIYSFKHRKVILLYGPPGTGKSTMARVLAKHCGYEPIEINASDERTGAQILSKIKTAISSDNHFTLKKTTDGAAKPVCLIVDEVDGALGSSLDGENSKGVQQIVDYLKKCIAYKPQNKTKSKADADDDDVDFDEVENEEEETDQEKKQQAKKKKKDTDVLELRRPIIFICNDMYARALFPLREIALTVKIEESSPDRLLRRLRHICKQEGVQIDDQVIRELAEETKYDARSCINTLQFISQSQRETGKRITVSTAVEAAGKFQCFKDTFDSVFSTADSLMLNKEQKTAIKLTPSMSLCLLSQAKTTVQSFGDPDLLNDFVFHNYPKSIAYFDDDCEKTALYLDLLSRNDRITTYVKRTQNYEMASSQYLPLYAFRRYCAGTRAIESRNEYPKDIRNQYFEKLKYDAVYDKLLDMKGRSRKGVRKVKKGEVVDDEERFKLSKNSTIQNGMKRSDFMYDVIPFLYHMIHPNIREINTQLFTKHERSAFNTAIEVMVLFDIQLRNDDDDQTKSLESGVEQNIARFEPDISSLVTFTGGRKEYMRNKTQILINQNYQSIKQRMLTASEKASTPSAINNKKAAVMNSKLSGFGFLADVVQQEQQNNIKKRKRPEFEEGKATGRFMYKFKEGHSKNFKRELTFDYFLV